MTTEDNIFKCQHCGVPFDDHPGGIVLCRNLQQALAENDALHKTIRAMADRIHGQSELLAKRAAKATP